jgi:RNA polymerase sigma-70 factor (ECF subfamily)
MPKADAAPTFEEVFHRYAPYVAKIGYRLLGRDGEVDDLVQDVFMAAHRGLSGLREPEAIRGWLATVTVRKAQRRLRRRKVWKFLQLDSEPAYEQVVAPDASPEQQAILGAVYRVLDQLPTNQRVAWTIRHVQGETLERTATLCNCSLATVKRRIKAAHELIVMEVGCG